MLRYVHTNIIARDAKKLIAFYKDVLGCTSMNEQRDLRGAWLDQLTRLEGAHITGEHLLLPGYEKDHPTLEIFSYDAMKDTVPAEINRPGLAHIAFEVDDVEQTLREILRAGGSCVGDTVSTEYPDGSIGVFVYAKDPEGNIVELQSWQREDG